MSKAKIQKAGMGNAAPAIRKELIAALSGAVLINQIINVWDDRFDTLKGQVALHLGQWLSDYDVLDLIWNASFRRLPQINVIDTPVPLSDYLTEVEILSMADEIMTTLRSLPRRYEVLIPLPNIKAMSDFFLAGPVSFVSLPSRTPNTPDLSLSQPSLAGLLGVALQHDLPGLGGLSTMTTYMKISASGYATNSRTATGFHDAIATLKRTVQVATTKEVFVKRQPTLNQAMVAALRRQDRQPILEALVYDLTGTATGLASPPTTVKLGLGMSSYLNQITVRDNWKQWTLNGPQPEAIEQFLIKHLSHAVEILTDEAVAGDAGGLRSAFEWAFDAAADDEAIGGCIKTCIALEAALGEESEERGVTERIADRVAYLIGNTPTNRKKMRDNMRDFYKLRSSLVHGKKTTITPGDYNTDWAGRAILETVLRKELASLEQAWQRRQPG